MPDRPSVGAVRVDHELCVGNGMCVIIAPNAFVLDDNGQSTVVDPEKESPEALREAADSCPMAAISLGEEAS